MNLLATFGQIQRHFPGWGLGEILIAIVIVAACIALVYVALTEFGIAIPGWVVRCFWIVVVAVVVILCIRLVLTL